MKVYNPSLVLGKALWPNEGRSAASSSGYSHWPRCGLLYLTKFAGFAVHVMQWKAH